MVLSLFHFLPCFSEKISNSAHFFLIALYEFFTYCGWCPLILYRGPWFSHSYSLSFWSCNIATQKYAFLGRIQWLTPIIPALCEAEVGGGPEVWQQPGQHGEILFLLKIQKLAGCGHSSHHSYDVRLCPDNMGLYKKNIKCKPVLGRLRQENCLNLGGGGCSEPLHSSLGDRERLHL